MSEDTPAQDPREYAKDQAERRNGEEKMDRVLKKLLSNPVEDWAATERKKMQDGADQAANCIPPAGIPSPGQIIDTMRDVERAVQRQVGIPAPGPIQRASPTRTDQTQPKIHIFTQGAPLCGFTSLRPVDWPKGHERISLEDAQRGVRFSCNECAKRIV